MTEKQKVLESITQALDARIISISDIYAIIKSRNNSTLQKSSNRLQYIISYIGGFIIFLGVYLFVFTNWPDLSSTARTALTLGVGASSLSIGVVAKAVFTARTFIVNTTTIISGLLIPIGMHVLFDTFDINSLSLVAWLGISFFAIAALYFVLDILLSETMYSFFSMIFHSIGYGYMLIYILTFTNPSSGLDTIIQWCVLLLGASYLFFAYYLNKDSNKVYRELYTVAGSILIFAMTFALTEPINFLPLLVVIPVIGSYTLAYKVNSNVLLFVSTIFLLIWINYLNFEYFSEQITFTGSLIITGFSLIIFSALSLRFRKIMNTIGHTIRRKS